MLSDRDIESRLASHRPAVGDDLPIYNMKAVAQETGLNPTTIRAWERRYGLPEPQRTEGGHRQYCRRDIELLNWLVARQEEGITIARAVEMWQRLQATPEVIAGPAADPLTAPAASGTQAADQLEALRQAWLDACLVFDRPRADQVLVDAFGRFAPEVVCLELLLPALAQIGQGWVDDEVTIQQEHFASELTVRRLETLISAVMPPSRPERILVACAPEDDHTIGPLLLTFLLRRRGWNVVYLGANVPAGEVETTLARVQPRLVILSAQQLHTAANLLDLAEAMRPRGVPLAYGGVIFNLLPALQKIIPGQFLSPSLAEAPRRVEELIRQGTPVAPAGVTNQATQRALRHYQTRRARIEAAVWEAYEMHDPPPTWLDETNRDLAQAIKAALRLGDMGLLGGDIEWAAHLLTGYRLSPEALAAYLDAYRQAAEAHLENPAAMVVDWLGQLCASATVEGRS